MSTLPLAHIHLLDKGWKPVHPEAHPNDTEWIDPRNPSETHGLLEAWREQDKRDEKEQVKR